MFRAKSSKGRKAYQTGANLEKRVARWLTSQFDYRDVERNELVRGKNSGRPV